MDNIATVRTLLDEFGASIAQVLESMTERRPEVRWQPANGGFLEIAGLEADVLWWEQPLQFAPDMTIWVASPRSSWEYAGTQTLKAAGLDTVELNEARNTWLEILGQSLSVVARSIGSLLGREVTCENGAEAAAPDEIEEWASFTVEFADAPLPPLLVAFSPKLLDVLSAQASPAAASAQELAVTANPDSDVSMPLSRSRTMELLLDVDLPVSISFGKTRLPMKDVIKLTTGSIVELNRGVGDPVEVLVNQCLIARGEVVVVEGNYGVRILEIASRQERLRSLR